MGFRPWLHREAEKLHLNGWCRNTGQGVEMEAEGEECDLQSLIADLKNPDEIPPLAEIHDVACRTVSPKGDTGFIILASKAGSHDTLIAPDLAICDDCRRELSTPGDRRYRYPFINCTNCGPRFTIIREVPYDRPKTSMGKFPMCPDCAREYKDITNRRYHAQPDCCDVCGPEISFISGKISCTKEDAVAEAKKLLAGGGILAIKGLGGFHLACLCDDETVIRLRKRKERNGKPFAIMCRDIPAAEKFCNISEAEKKILDGPRKPIVLLDKKDPYAYAGLSRSDTVGIMLPYTPLHILLFENTPYDALVMTSANLSEKPVIFRNEEALNELEGIADGFLLHNRDILRRCDDSLVQVIGNREVFYRRSRGYTPAPLYLHFDADHILALGSEQKASFAIGKGKRVFMSQHIGDLKNIETLSFYETQIHDFENLFGVKAETLVCDLHPDYLSTRYASERSKTDGLKLIQVQHHHAHMASCMADNGLNEPCIGIIFDGTGLGTDSTIWGSEILYGDYRHVERFASLKPIPLPGGDAVTEEIGRTAFSLSYISGLDEETASCTSEKNKIFKMMITKNINSPLSSGMGRMFDGVYSLITGVQYAGYEGEAAVLLECLANRSRDEREHFVYSWENDGVLRMDWRVMIRDLMKQKEEGVSSSVLAMRFHNTMIEWACEACRNAGNQTGIRTVVLSGGSFFNRIMTEGIVRKLEEEQYTVYTHHRVSPGDEGIALGQLAAAKAML